jgi:MOSC domain-containing protein YiiM
MSATLTSIAWQPPDRDYDEGRFDDFIRVPSSKALLLENHGIEGDRKAGHNRNRQLNILSAEWLEARRAEGYRAGPGEFGEQLIVRGLDVLALQPGDRLRIGDEAVIEMTKPRTGCSRLEAAQGRQVTCGPIGMLARVVAGGTIQVGDPVQVLSRKETSTPTSS